MKQTCDQPSHLTHFVNEDLVLKIFLQPFSCWSLIAKKKFALNTGNLPPGSFSFINVAKITDHLNMTLVVNYRNKEIN